MARELHTLNEEELGLVQDYVDSGIADTQEEALQYLLESGSISGSVSKGGSFMPEGFVELLFHSGHPKSKFTQVDKLAKKSKKDSPFETENWYLGSEFPKDEDGNINLDGVKVGDCVGMSPEIIVTHIQYKGIRFNPADKDSAVDTTLQPNMFTASQKEMIDMKSKRSLFDLRAEQVKEAGVKVYNELKNEDKIKFQANVFGIVKTEDGWKPFLTKATIGKPEYNMVAEFIEELNSKKKLLTNYICKIDTEEDVANAGNYFKIIKIQSEIDADTKEEVKSLFRHNAVSISKFLADQKEYVKNGGTETSTDTENEDEIDWDNKK